MSEAHTARFDGAQGPSAYTTTAEGGRTGTRQAPRGIGERLLRIPLFWKLTVANAVVAVLVYLLGLFVGVRVVPRVDPAAIHWIVGITLTPAAGVGILLNALLVRLALTPLRRLEETARSVDRGNLDARVGTSVLADRDLSKLMARFDEMLASLARARARQRRMASRVLESEERTRERIARRLYDDTAQHLASLLIRMPAPGRGGEGPEARAELVPLRSEIASALEGIRASARRLRPPELDELGLPVAIRAEARTFEEQTGRAVEVDVPPDLPSPFRNGALALFRIVQEALSLADGSGSEAAIRVTLNVANGRVVVRVSQEGTDFAAALEGDRHGSDALSELAERAGYVGGDVAVSRAEGRSALTVRISLSPEGGPGR